mgnify:FL=1
MKTISNCRIITGPAKGGDELPQLGSGKMPKAGMALHTEDKPTSNSHKMGSKPKGGSGGY